jgi:glucose/arabinose dehydrogenase
VLHGLARMTALLSLIGLASLGTTWSAAQSAALKTYSFPADQLASPNHTPSASNPAKVVARPDGAELTLPPGFRIETFAEGGFKRPRWVAQAPGGDVFVTDATANTLMLLRDENGNRRIDNGERYEFATGLNQPFGIAFWEEWLYVANTDTLVRFRYRSGQTKAAGAPEKVADLPSTPGRGHWTRNVIVSPDGTSLYVATGSGSNVDPDDDPQRATIARYNPDGSGREIVATGVRNPIGLGFHPDTRRLWMAVQERDGLGDELVPDFLTELKEGAFYGWPYAYLGPNEEPRRAGERSDLVSKTTVPDLLFQSHSAVMGIAFYDGRMFPQRYRSGAFAAFRGSSNRSQRTGYKVVFVPFENGRPAGGYEDFIVGWMLGEDRAEVWGRPVGVLVLQDGSLLVTDDGAQKIWRVTYAVD